MKAKKMKFRISGLVVTVASLLLPMAAQVGGTGTTNHVPLWTNSTTLGNSVLFQSGGNVGIGNTTPAAILDVSGKPGTTAANSGNAPTALRTTGGSGANIISYGTAGSGGPIQATSGSGGRANQHLAERLGSWSGHSCQKSSIIRTLALAVPDRVSEASRICDRALLQFCQLSVSLIIICCRGEFGAEGFRVKDDLKRLA